MRLRQFLLIPSILSLSVSGVSGQGPDVIVGELNGIDSYGNGGAGTIYAYAVGTTACNIGSQVLNWSATTNQHPVIGQNVYRLKAGRFEMIAMGWLKHGTGSATGNLCGSCQNPGTNQLLGVNCSDPYGAGTNGYQPALGPRSEVNATTGYFPFPPANPAWSGPVDRRVQCQAHDINPALNAGALYFAEGQYVTSDETAAGQRNNNASYRAVTFAAGTFSATLTGATFQQQPAIMAWAAADPAVVIQNVDLANDGRFVVAKRVTSLGGSNYHHEFAIQNLNSNRSGRGFTVDFPLGTGITNAGFKDVAYHSGESLSGTDWTIAINGASITWATELYVANQNANALRFGTLYNFSFDATAAADIGWSIEPFKPPGCPADPVITPGSSYVLDASAPFDNPTTAGTNGPDGDDSAQNVPIGFAFSFYGTSHSSAWISTNGFITFGSADAIQWVNACIPSGGTPNALIASYWDDLLVDPGETKYETVGVAPNRRFVVSWANVGLWSDPGSLQTFKIILDETTNKITSTIVASADGGSSATCGIERDDGLVGVQASCDAPGSVVANTSKTYTPLTSILSSADLTITGSTSPNSTLTWNVNSNAIGAPVVLVASLDPGPINLGPLGVIDLGLAPGLFVVLADGGGVFQPANPAHFTDACGDFVLSILTGPFGVPLGLTVYNQGVVISATSVPPPPNGAFHITDMALINT